MFNAAELRKFKYVKVLQKMPMSSKPIYATKYQKDSGNGGNQVPQKE